MQIELRENPTLENKNYLKTLKTSGVYPHEGLAKGHKSVLEHHFPSGNKRPRPNSTKNPSFEKY